MKDANLKAEHIVSGAEGQIQQQKQQMVDLKKQVSDFRAQLLDMYRRHLTLIDALPTAKEEPAAPPEPAYEPAPAVQPEPVPSDEEMVELEPALFDKRPAVSPDSVQEPTLEFQAGISNFDEF